MKFNKKANTTATAIGLVLFIIVLSVGALVVSTVNSSFTSGTAEQNLTQSGLTMFQNMVGLIPVLGIVFIAGIVIFFVVRGLGGSAGGGL